MSVRPSSDLNSTHCIIPRVNCTILWRIWHAYLQVRHVKRNLIKPSIDLYHGQAMLLHLGNYLHAFLALYAWSSLTGSVIQPFDIDKCLVDLVCLDYSSMILTVLNQNDRSLLHVYALLINPEKDCVCDQG